MIVVYPLLVDNTVSQSVLPGVCKAIEKYILLYRLEEVVRRINSSNKRSSVVGPIVGAIGTALAIVGAEIILKKAKEYGLTDNTIVEQSGTGTKPATHFSPKDIHKTIPKKINIDMPSKSTISLEPTWVRVDAGDKSALIGIKVVPFPIDTGGNLAKVLFDESKSKWIYSRTVGFMRGVVRTAYSIMRSLKMPYFKDKAITGNVKEDVLYGSTTHKHNVFLLLNSSDVSDDMFKNAGGIHKLFKMGWTSFAIADDVNKKVTFCMKEFRGLCSQLPYAFIYAAAGKEQLKVFEDLNDVRKAATPFFRMKGRADKLFEESVLDVLEQYREVLKEDATSFIKNYNSKKVADILKMITPLIKKKDYKKVKSIISAKLPKMTLEDIEKAAIKMDPNFKRTYAMSKMVLSNSLTGIQEDIINASAMILAFSSSFQNEDALKATKENLKAFVYDIRKKTLDNERIICKALTLAGAGKTYEVPLIGMLILGSTL